MIDRGHPAPAALDLQATAPDVQLGLSRVGITGITKAIRLRRGTHEKLVSAELRCSIHLDAAQRGVHMSRFPEVIEEAIDEVVTSEAFLVEELAEHIAERVAARHRAHAAEVEITADYPIARKTPVTGLPTQEMITLLGIAATRNGVSRRVVGVEATGMNACPCAQGLVRERAAERLTTAGYDDDDVEQILTLVPLATHNQRGRGTLFVGTSMRIDAEELVTIVQRSMSSPIFELLKRADELFVVEHAHLQPRFVEDSVRFALSDVLAAYPGLSDDDFVCARQINLETIHAHDVVAERWGTLAELRAELAQTGVPGTRHTPLREWLLSVHA